MDGAGFGEATFDFTVETGKGSPAAATSALATFTTAESQTINIGSFEFTEPGEYSYTVTETTKATTGWTNDNEPKTVTITVKDNGEGQLVAEFTSATIENSFKIDTTLTVNKKITNKGGSSTGAFFLGQDIEYSITVTNDGNVTYTNVVVDDPLTGDNWKIESLDPGASQTFTAKHTVTEEDIIAGSVTNAVTAKGDPIGDQVPEGEDTVTTGDEDDPDGPTPPIEDPNPRIDMAKIVTSQPANGSTYSTGETITWNIVVLNQGNLSLTNVRVSDQLRGATGTAVIQPGAGYTVSGSIATIPSLPVTGENMVVIPVSYTVLVTDAGASLTNATVARAPNPVPGGDDVTDDAESTPVPVTPTPTPVPPTPTPTPTPTPVPVVPATVVPPAPAAPAVTPIADNPTPQAQTIEDDGNALGDGGSWSLFDLICTVVATILSIIMLIFALGRNRKEGDDEETAAAKTANGEEAEEDQILKRKRIARILSIIPAVGSIVLFVLTQDLTQPMAIFDNWSIVFGIIGIINIVLAIATKTTKNDDDEEQQQTPQSGFVPAGPASL